VGDVERGEDSDFERVNGERARRDFAHAAIHELGELRDVLAVAVRADVVNLIVNLHADRRRARLISGWFDGAHDLELNPSDFYLRIASTISGSSTAMASSMASTFMRIVSRSASSRSTCVSSRSFSSSKVPSSRRMAATSRSRLS